VGWGSGPDHSVWHQPPGTRVWLWPAPGKGASLSRAWGGGGPALMSISVCQTGSPRSSNWPQSWSSTWAQSLLSAAWPPATRCLPVTVWSCARLTAPCSRYGPHALAPPPSPCCRLPQKHPLPRWSAGQLQASTRSQGAEPGG